MLLAGAFMPAGAATAGRARWINRSLRDPGMLFRWSAMTKNIINRGGIWGGFWRYPDYQHFELH
jgi:hypothetical protein